MAVSEVREAIIRTGDTFRYEPWGGDCTAVWVQGELWITRDPNSTDETRVFKTITGGATRLLKVSSEPQQSIVWENALHVMAAMPDENTISVWVDGMTAQNFVRTSPSHEHFVASIHDGDIFYYRPWGGFCTAQWVENELWMARDLNSTEGTLVWKTTNGDGQRLLRNGTVHLRWDNCRNLVAFMPNPNTITVWHGHLTYNFTREAPPVPVAEPVGNF
jgi:hypothetical protein